MTWVIAFALRELDERVGDARALQLDDLRAELLREADVVLQRDVIVRLDAARLLLRRFDVDGEPVGREPAGDARADAQQRSSRCRATPSPPSPSRE